jgi:hypothetical protein
MSLLQIGDLSKKNCGINIDVANEMKNMMNFMSDSILL